MSEITNAQKTQLLKLPGFKEIQKQFAKENQNQAGSGKKRMRGRGFWQEVGNWFSQAGKDINQFLKDSKIVSNVAAYALPILGALGGSLLTANPLGSTAGGIAGKSAADYIKSQGYGMCGKGLGLAIYPPNQRMRGINPKSKMRGAGLKGKGYGTNFNTVGMNGIPQISTVPVHSGIIHNIGGKGIKARPAVMKGMGGTEFGVVSSEFGNVRW